MRSRSKYSGTPCLNSRMMRWMGLVCVWGAVVCSGEVRQVDAGPQYPPDWAALDARPLPAWYDSAKLGIFLHWGPYSVPSYTSEWFWIDWKGDPSPNKKLQVEIDKFMKTNYPPNFSYQDFAPQLTAEFFNASQWVEIFKKSGAKYVVLTSKHHDGFTMWPSKYSFSWNSQDVAPHRDIVGELAAAVRNTKGLRFGLYHSLYEWFHPLYLQDKAANFSTQNFVDNKIMPEMKELVEKYKPEVFWSDGDGEAPDKYWKSEQFLSWLYSESKVKQNVVANDRWGIGTNCKHGGFLTCADRYSPGVLQEKKWENAMTLDRTTWGYSRASNLENYLSAQELIDTLASTIACGGNMLVNVGPTKEGTIAAIFQDRLASLGSWLDLHGEAVYDSTPWDTCQNDTYTPLVWYTAKEKGKSVYAIVLRWPTKGTLYLACPQLGKKTTITMLGVPGNLQAVATDKRLTKIDLPDRAVAPGHLGWVLKMTELTVM